MNLADLNKSGNVSTTEIVSLLKTFDLIASESEASDSKKMVEAIQAVFRIFDLDGNGCIDVSEIQRLTKEILQILFDFLLEILSSIQNISKDEPLVGLVDMFSSILNSSEKCLPISVKELIEFLNAGYESEHLGEILIMIFSVPEMIFGESELFDDILKLIQITQNEWSVFVSEMKAAIETKTMSEKACAEVGTSCIKKVLAEFSRLGESVQIFILNIIMDKIYNTLRDLEDENPFKWIHVPREKVQNILGRISGSIHSFLDEQGIHQYLVAFFSLLLCDHPPRHADDVTPLYAFVEFIEYSLRDGEVSNLKEKAIRVQEALITMVSIIDTDGNNLIDKPELYSFAIKIADIFFAWFGISLKLVENAAVHGVPSLASLALDVKFQILGGDRETLTHIDVCTVVLLFMILQGDYEILSFVKDLFAYTEENCDKRVFENFSSNILRVMMISPEARITSKQFLRYTSRRFTVYTRFFKNDMFCAEILGKYFLGCQVMILCVFFMSS